MFKESSVQAPHILFYTYLWLRYDGTPYYVGKGHGKRAFRRGSPPLERIIVQEWTSEREAFDAEIFLIFYYGRIDKDTGCLRNLTDGGDGPTGQQFSNDSRRKMSEAARAFISTRGNGNCILGGRAHKGMKRKLSHKLNLAASAIKSWTSGSRKQVPFTWSESMPNLLHVRWHVNRGIKKENCSYCEA